MDFTAVLILLLIKRKRRGEKRKKILKKATVSTIFLGGVPGSAGSLVFIPDAMMV